MSRTGRVLLPQSRQLAALSVETAREVLALADAESRRAHRYAALGFLCGTFSLLLCLAAYVYLVVHGHDTAAGVVLGTGILAVIGTMIRAR